MIVKNEAKVILRCLNSVLPIIDSWVIVDTGSTDGTQRIISNFMQEKNVPGTLHERPWISFPHNRNEALDLARDKGDYILLIDADQYLEFKNDFKLPILNKDYYLTKVNQLEMLTDIIILIKSGLNWAWKGILHETIISPEAETFEYLEDLTIISTQEGHSWSDPQKYLKYASILEGALKEDPENSRYIFYLAQSYQNANEYPKALEFWNKRISMGNNDEEVYWAMFQKANVEKELNFPSDAVFEGYRQAFYFRPSRAESLYSLATFCREKGDFELGYQITTIGKQIPLSNDCLYVIKWIYDYGILMELAFFSVLIGKKEEAIEIYRELLQRPELPKNIREWIKVWFEKIASNL